MNLIPPTIESLMDVLTRDGDGDELDYQGIVFLTSQWDVKPVLIYSQDGGRPRYNWAETIRKLAQHVQKQSGG